MKPVLPALLLILSGCSLAPVYSGGTSGQAAMLLSAIEVAPISERSGFLVRDRLLAHMAPGGNARFRLVVLLDDRIEGSGLRGDNSIIRERRVLRARYQLIELATGRQLLDSTAAADAGIDVVTSEYAVVAAETSALERLSQEIADQIATRVALLVRALPPA